MDAQFCSRCGGKLEEKFVDEKKRLVCSLCGRVNYLNPIPATAVTIIENNKILLVKRAIEPKRGLWSLPAGFIEINESVEQCAVREVKEETNLDVELDGLIGVYSVFDDPRYVCLLVVYKGKIVGGELRPGDDASEAKYFPSDNLPEFAFKVHKKAVEAAFEQLK